MRPRLVKMLFLLMFTNVIVAQSYFAISAGSDRAQLKEGGYGKFRGFVVENHKYAAESKFFSVSGEKNLTKKLALNLNFSVTKKEADISMEALIAIIGMRFSIYRSMLSLKWQPNKYLYVGSGFVLHYIANLRNYNIKEAEEPIYINNYKKFGTVIYVGATHKNFFLEPYLIQGFWTFKKSENMDLSPINSFGLSLGYRLRVSKK